MSKYCSTEVLLFFKIVNNANIEPESCSVTLTVRFCLCNLYLSSWTASLFTAQVQTGWSVSEYDGVWAQPSAVLVWEVRDPLSSALSCKDV